MYAKRFFTLTLLMALTLNVGGATAQSSSALRSLTSDLQPLTSVPLAHLGPGFTYQGQLLSDGKPITDTCDFQFDLWDAAGSGSQIGSTQTLANIQVNKGLFTVLLNDTGRFGARAFDGSPRWLEIEVRCPAGSGSFTTLSPRQAVTAAPYALFAADVAPYANLVVVAQSGGDFISIQAALDSITTNNDSNRYLVWVAPGTYTETVTMKPYVDIEGAGELTTRITHTGSTSLTTGTVVGANDAELRFLTVENTGGNTFAIAIYNDSASPRLTHVTAIASGGNSNIGVVNRFSSPKMTDVTATASGGSTSNTGVDNDSSSPTMTGVTATASGEAEVANYGVRNFNSSSPMMTNVTATASAGKSNVGVGNSAGSSPMMTNVTALASGGAESINYGVLNSSSSPKMSNVTATAVTVTGSEFALLNRGVSNISSSPIMTDVIATASGSHGNIGVENSSGSSPTMIGVTAIASGGRISIGVSSFNSSPTIQNSTIHASEGNAHNVGIETSSSSGEYTITVSNSQIVANFAAITSDPRYTIRVGASLLDGGVLNGGGTFICVGAYDGNFVTLDTDCT